jgi:hypothetical protein
MKRQTITAAAIGAMTGAAIVHGPITFESKGIKKIS